MSINYGKDYDYASSRLVGSFIFHDGKFGKVDRIDSKSGIVDFSYLEMRNMCRDRIPLEEFDIKSPKLGYFNSPSSAIYLVRIPARRFRQGLTPQTVKDSTGLVSVTDTLLFNLSYYNSINFDPELSINLLLNEEKMSIAFSKNFAVTKNKNNLVLDYKGRTKGVGIFNPKTMKAELLGKYLFLNEQLTEELGELT